MLVQEGWFKPWCVLANIILVSIVLVVPLLEATEENSFNIDFLRDKQNCTFTLIESYPEGLKYNDSSPIFQNTFNVWKDMIASAKNTIEIASFYWTLRAGDLVLNFPGTQPGAEIFDALVSAGKDRGIKLKLVQSQPTKKFPNTDTEELSKKAHAEVRTVNMTSLFGSGVLHSKLWIVDREKLYVGSANTDWRALSQVKELGVYITNCSDILKDMAKIFDVYWAMGVPHSVLPDKWPASLSTDFNKKTPLDLYINNSLASVFISSSPPQFCPSGRTTDLNSILDTIYRADKFIYISVMNYIPIVLFTQKIKFWPEIDNALREVAINNKVEVRLLISLWKSTSHSELKFLRSLQAISEAFKGVHLYIKLFKVPSTPDQAKIPFARVNHNKYMVTDNTAYIGTSNWSGDYFISTAGIGVVTRGNTTLREQLESIFLRDWNSDYATPLRHSGST